MPVNATGEIQCSQGEMVTRGHPPPPGLLIPPSGSLDPLDAGPAPTRRQGESGCKAPGLGARTALCGVKAESAADRGRLLGVPPRL